MSVSHIVLNDFYSREALPKWNFDVAFAFYIGTETGTDENRIAGEYSKLLTKSVTDIKFPGTRIEKLLTYLPGMMFGYPGKPNLNGELTLTFNDDVDLTIRRIVNYLLQENYNPRYQQHEILDDGTDGYISKEHITEEHENKKFFDIYVRIRNTNGECVQKVVYKNCFVKSLGGLTLDYSGEELIRTTATFSYPYFKVLEPEGQDSE